MDEYRAALEATKTDEELLDLCRRRNLHGTPYVFQGNEEAYYAFRQRVAEEFEIGFEEVYVVGSAKLGFSPHKRRPFGLDSDIDVAIVSSALFERIMETIYEYQMQLRGNRKAVTDRELGRYHEFLEYGAIGWMRPDLLPTSFRVRELKTLWFEFFKSISYGSSEVGDYKVAAGVFKTYAHLENYTISGLRSLRAKLQVESGVDNADQA